jgi:hypothetical protein
MKKSLLFASVTVAMLAACGKQAPAPAPAPPPAAAPAPAPAPAMEEKKMEAPMDAKKEEKK